MKKQYKIVLLLLLSFVSLHVFADFHLVKPTLPNETNYSGDNQHGALSDRLPRFVRFKVVSEKGAPVSNIPVILSLISSPKNADGFSVRQSVIYTDEAGIAQTAVILGSVEGEYEIMASIGDKEHLVYRFFARSSNWWLFIVIGLAGGLALFLFGMDLMGKGLQRSLGNNIRSVLGRLTNNNFLAVLIGALVTMVIQSSSATAVMLVSFVNTGMMRFRQTLCVLLGAAVGTTITAQLIAFKLSDYSLIIVALGAIFMMLFKNEKVKQVGEAIFGFGLLYYGMWLMAQAMYPLRSFEPFLDLLLNLENPLLGILVGALFTSLVHSSSAIIGIIMIFATQGLLTLDSAFALLLGANLGTPSTALIASWNTSVESKKVAFAQLFYKIFMVVAFIFFLHPLADLFNYLSFGTTAIDRNAAAEVMPRQIANAHTIFNIVLCIAFLPIISYYERFINWLVRDKKTPPPAQTYSIKYLDQTMIETPALALNLAKQETIRLGKKVLLVHDEIVLPFINNQPFFLEDLNRKRLEIKNIRDEIKQYLIEVSRRTNQTARINEAFQMLHVVQELSHINDAVTKILYRRAEKWIERNYEFSEEGKEEILLYQRNTKELLVTSLAVFAEFNLEAVKTVKKKKKALSKLAESLENRHFERLVQQNPQELENSKTHLELVNTLKVIGQHAANISKVFTDVAVQ